MLYYVKEQRAKIVELYFQFNGANYKCRKITKFLTGPQDDNAALVLAQHNSRDIEKKEVATQLKDYILVGTVTGVI